MTPLLTKLDEMEKHFAKVAEASSDDFGHSVTACMEWQVSQLWKLDEDAQKLIAALRRAVEGLRCEQPDYCAINGGEFAKMGCGNCKALADIEKILGAGNILEEK